MKSIWKCARFACIGGALLLIAGCGGSQSGIGAPGVLRQNSVKSESPLYDGNFKVLYNFTGGSDGSGPALFAALAMSRTGNLFGAAAGGTGSGCNGPCGVVFEMTPGANGKWNESVLFDFSGYYVDGEPVSSLALDSKGNLYGAAIGGKQGYGALIYQLTPGSGGWTFNIIEDPGTDIGLIADAAGKNLYGFFGDLIKELSPDPTHWTQKKLHNLCPTGWKCREGDQPLVPLSWDAKGNLYGTTYSGGLVNYKDCGGYCGVAFQLTPNGDGTWKYHLLHLFGSFNGDGVVPYGGLTVDTSGNVYGTTTHRGPYERGTVFKLSHTTGDRWKETLLYGFPAECNCAAPGSNLVFDKAGNLYGTAATFVPCIVGGNGCGLVFRLTPEKSGNWKFSVVHLFRGPDGEYPNGLTLDNNGRLYGTTTLGGSHDVGVVFEITP
jgi:hypothetical protein